MRRLFSIASLLALAHTPAAQAPVLEAPHTATLAPAPAVAGGVQTAPYVSAGDGTSLVVWIDHRAEFTTPLANQGGPDVFAMRVDAAGQPLDPVAIRLPREVGDKSNAKAAWNGEAWLVTWENQQPLGTSSFFRLILGARIAGDGALLDADPIVVKDDLSTTGSTTAVASDGTDWVVVAQGTDSNSGSIVGVRVTAAGSVANPGGTVLATLSSAIFGPDLEYAGGRYFMTYGSGSVFGFLFTQDLVALGAPFSVGTGSSARPRAATDGADFLVVWMNSNFGQNVRARRVRGSTGGMSPVIQVTTLSNFESNWDPDVAWTGAQWIVSFRNGDDDAFRAARIASDLTLLDLDGIELQVGGVTSDERMVLASTGGDALAVFETQDLTQAWPGEVRVSGVDASLAASPPVVLSLSAPRQGFPAVASGAGQHLLVFQTETLESMKIEMQRLDAFGAPLDLAPIELASGNRLGKPAVAWNGDSYLVVWEDLVVPSFETDDVVRGVRVSADGSVLDEPFFVMDGNSPDVAAQGGTFLVVSSDAPSTDQFRFPFAQRVSADGTLVGSAVQLGSNFSRFARVAPLGSGWVAVWQRNFTHDNPNSIANAALVAADGTASPEFLVDGAAGFGGASRPNVASSGDEALLVWQDDFTGLAARRVTAGGQLTGAFAVAPLPALPALPDAIWNGEEYVVVWQDYRAQVGLWDYRTDVYAARVSESGALQDGGGGVAIANGIETELLPAVTGALGSTLFAYDELLPEAPYATLVVRVRRESPWANLGGGVGGPLLLGQGELAPGQTMSFHVASAPAGAFGVHLFGISELSLPFLGGTLVPSPLFDLGFTSDVDGAATLDLPIFSSVPSGTELFVQSWVVDLASPTNVAGTNAVRTSVP